MRIRAMNVAGALLFGVALLFPLAASADETKAPPKGGTPPGQTANPDSAAKAGQTPMTMKEVKEKLGIVVFPAKGQDAATQEADELACLQWGAEQAGVTKDTKPKDAKAAGEAAEAHVDSVARGAAVKGAAKGAAAGAIVGSLWGEGGSGAAYGAAGGAIAGRRAKKQASKNAKAQAEQKVSAENQAKIDAVKKGMTACLEGKGYTVK